MTGFTVSALGGGSSSTSCVRTIDEASGSPSLTGQEKSARMSTAWQASEMSHQGVLARFA